MNIPLILLAIYFVGMIPAIFVARKSIRVFYSGSLEDKDSVVNYFLFPSNMFILEMCGQIHPTYSLLIGTLCPVVDTGVRIGRFYEYVVITAIVWPLKVVWLVSIVFLAVISIVIREVFRKISSVLRKFATL